jgi:hypothetical protein
MSFIASMVAAAGTISAAAGGGILGGLAVGATGALGGAGLGAAASAIDGGDPLEGAQLGAGIGSAVFGGLGALGQAGIIGSAAPIAGSAAPIAGSALPTVSTEIGKEAIKAGTEEAIKAGTEQAVVQGTGQVANSGISALPAVDPTAAVNPASQAVVNPAASQATTAALPPPIDQGGGVITQGLGAQSPPPMAQPLPGSQPLNVLAEVPQNSDVLLNGSTGPGWGQQLLNKAGVESQVGSKIGGKALESAVINSGINGLVAGAQGQDVGEAMGKGALTGAVGGAASEGLASMAGPGGSLSEGVGNFAAKHDVLVPAALSMGSGMALDSALTSDPTMPEQKGIRSLYKWNPSVYKPYGPQFAAGGVTDLDNYDQTPQMQNPGTLDIPNRNEVTNNQGYMGDSVQMMAHGGISDLGGYSDGGRLLKGPGNGVSDDIPATIAGKQPARLATNEFVVPARIVSEIGNGSTDAGAKALYAMMDRVQKDRSKSMGKGKFAVDSKASRHLDSL